MITNYPHNNSFVLVVAMLLAILVMATAAQGQTGFTYQGRLTDGGTSANGNYDLQFALWNSLSGGAQVGSTQTLTTVAVSNGVFTVTLDFGANAFPGASRFLEISTQSAPTDHSDSVRDPQFECIVSRQCPSQWSLGRQWQLHSELKFAAGNQQLQHQRQRHRRWQRRHWHNHPSGKTARQGRRRHLR
jgi:hypothetical protein